MSNVKTSDKKGKIQWYQNIWQMIARRETHKSRSKGGKNRQAENVNGESILNLADLRVLCRSQKVRRNGH